MKIICKRCGGTNVETKEWYNHEQQTVTSLNDIGIIQDEDTFCIDCDENTGIEYKLDIDEEDHLSSVMHGVDNNQ